MARILNFFRNNAANLQRDDADALRSDQWGADRAASPEPGPQGLPPVTNDIALVGFFSDGTTAGTDTFAFVILADLSGETINFTDNGWLSTGAFRTGEGIVSYTVPAGTPIGTVVTLPGAGVFNLSTGGDQIIAFTGTLATPTAILFALDFANAQGWDATAADTNTSAVPTGLSDGVNALSFATDNGAYSGSTTGTRAQILTNIANAANWTLNEAAPGPSYPGNFTVTGGTETQTVVFDPTSVTQAEGDSGATIFTFTVRRTGGTTGQVDFSGSFTHGNTDAADFNGGTPAGFSGSILAGQQTGTFTITVQGDDIDEDDENFSLLIENATNGSAGVTTVIGASATATGNITDDDEPGVLSVGDVTLAEGNAGTTNFVFTVTRSGGDDGTVSVDYTVNLPGGMGGADATDIPGTLTGTVTFLDGETSATITVGVAGDTSFEPDETFTVTLSNAQGGATIGDDTGLGTITNDDAAPAGTLAINDVSLGEGNSGPTTFTFTVSRTGGSAGAVTADYVITAPGGAGNADTADFVSGAVFSGQVSFADTETSKTITIDVQGDTDFEANENFTVTLSNATGGATIGDGTGAGTIQNDDINTNPGNVSIADVSIVEGDGAGTVTLVFTVTRSGGTAAFAVDFASSDGGLLNHASATAGSDYAANSGTLNFGLGENSQTVSITVNSDDVDELSEELTLTLSNATNGATLTDAVAIGTITTDDVGAAGPTGVWLNEFHYDNSGTDTGEFIEIAGVAGTDLAGYSLVLYNGSDNAPYATINLSGVIPNQAGGYGVLQFAAVGLQNGAPDGIAFAGPGGLIEFISYEGTMTAAGGVANGQTSVDVGVTEPGNAAGTSIGRTGGPTSNWVLFSDDTPGVLNTGQSIGPAPTISVSDVSVDEDAGTMTFTVTRTNVVPGAFSVNYATANGTATAGAGEDYLATSGTLNFADNQTQATVTVTINPDSAAEFDETLFLNLSNATNGALIEDNQAVGTIVNDDGEPIIISINNVVQAEGTAGTTSFVFTVTRSGGTDAFSVDFDTDDGTATEAGNDYETATGTLNFAIGELSKTITVTVNGDATPEGVENFFVNLTNASPGVIINDGSGTGVILDGAGTINFIHDIQGTAYFSPLLAGEGISTFNVASAGLVTVSAIVTAVDNVGNRQGFYIQEEITDWDGNRFTSEGIFVMTRNDAGVGTAVSGVAVGDLVTVSAQVMEYQGFASNMPITALVNPSAIVVQSSGNALPAFLLDASHAIPNSIMTGVTPDYTDSSDGAGDSFDASLYGLSYWETVEGMLVTVPDMVVADGFVGGAGFMQAYSTVHADADQINSRGGYTIAGDPPNSPPDTADTEDGTTNGGRVLHDGDVNPDIIELDWSGFADAPPPGLLTGASMGDLLGDVTGIIDFEFIDRKLFVTDMEPGGWVNGTPTIETTTFGDDSRSLTVATFNVENLDPGDGAARFTALANAIANNLNSPDIICIEEMQDNNGATSSGGADASTTWGMLVAALNAATGKVYQWVDQEPTAGAEGGEPGGNIRVGFLYDTGRVQLGNLDANATLAERRQYTDRIGDGVRDANDLIAFDDSMVAAEINTADWATTRRSLLGEFNFNGNTVYVTANHWPAKGGSGDFWQFNQNLGTGDPENRDWEQRSEVAEDVYSMLNFIQAANANAGIVAGGDFNDFYFYRPLEVMTGYVMADGSVRSGGARFDNLTLTLAEAERYTYTFDGRSQAIDHVIANQLLSAVATYDVVHLNTGFNPTGTPALSDHDPGVATFDYRNFAERLTGTGSADGIHGFGGDDYILTLDGDDLLIGGTGADNMVGGTGNDTYYVDNAADLVVEAAGEGFDIVFAETSYALGPNTSIEVLVAADIGSVAALNLVGNGQANFIYGSNGDNLIRGGGGADYLRGFGGNDTYYVDSTDDYVFELAGEGFDVVFTSTSYSLAAGSSVEVLSSDDIAATTAMNFGGNELANFIYGNNGANLMIGGGGADYLRGFGGDDTYYVDQAGDVTWEAAGEGGDIVYASASYALTAGSSIEVLSTDGLGGTAAIDLTGNELANLVYGNAGANVLNGGGGADYLLGLGGADTFAFTTALGGGNVDILADMVAGTDKIALDDAIFAGIGTPGAFNAGAFVVGSAAQDGNDRIVYNAATGQLFYDADGNGGGAAVLFATLQGNPALTASDFQVI